MSIRVRLALWCAALSCGILGVIAVVVYVVHSRAEYRDVDRTLAAVTEHYRSEIERELAAGAPLDRRLLAALDAAGPSLVGASLTVFAADGTPIVGGTAAAEPIARRAAPSHEPDGFATIETPEGRIRLHAMLLTAGGTTVGYVQSAVSLADLDRSVERFRTILIGATVVGVVVAGLGSLATASRALRPIFNLTETARAIALSQAFGRRIEAADARDELGELARTFNEMLASLQAAHEGQRRFVDDAAHELRAPLTSITGNLELLDRARDLPASEREAALGDVRAEAERLARLVNDLLVLARADAGQRLALGAVDLDRLVVEVVRQAAGLDKGIDIAVAGLAQATVRGDADRLRELLLILVDNAVRYTPAGGAIRVSLHRREAEAIVTVEDTGIGIAAEDLPRIFDRFYRADRARARDAGGTGLGLAIAKWIAEAHDGAVEVESRLGSGSTFRVVLPAVRPAAVAADRPAAAVGVPSAR